MGEETSVKGSLKQKSSLSTKQSRVTKESVLITIKEEDEEEEITKDDLEEAELSKDDDERLEDASDTEKYVEEETDEEEFLKNPGLSQAYNFGPAKPLKNEVDEALYLRLVKEAKIMPVNRIVRSVDQFVLNLQYYGLGNEQIKPLSETLMGNSSVKELNLKSNILSLDAMYHLGLMLRRNVCLQVLNLSHCRITAEGIELLGYGLELCPLLAVLDLSYNDFGDKGMEILANKLCENTSIINLNLSHNNLTHKTGMYLAETMGDNDTLQHLDLSWNQMAEDQGLKKFLNAAAEHNESIISLDLSWNTLSGEKTANTIKTLIGQHKTLQELNICHNRFETAAEVTKIAKGINSAQSLREINLSYNGITADAAYALLSSINTKTKLKTLRLDNVWVKPEFEKLRRELQSQTGMKVVIEGVTGGFNVKGPDMQTLLLKRAHHLGYLPKKQKNKKDFGWFLLRLQQTGNLVPVKKAKFEKLVTEDKIKFDEGMVDELSKRFKDDNKKIDLNLMLEKYLLLYPETALPIVKEKKKKKTSKETKKSAKESTEKQVEESVKEDVEDSTKEVKKSTEDAIEEITTQKIKESIRSQIKETIIDETKEEIKEIETTAEIDEEIIEPKIPEPEQTEDNITVEKLELEEESENKVENIEEEFKPVVIEENHNEVVNDMSTEEPKEEDEGEERLDVTESQSKLKKWRVVRSSRKSKSIQQ